MFIGTYYNKLEEKGRLCLPKSFRSEKDINWIISPGLDGGLFLFPEATFASELEKLASLEFNKADQRNLIRLMTNQSQIVTTDKAGRLLIPPHLIQLAKFNKDIVIIGSLSRLEVWDQALYHQLLDNINENSAQIAERVQFESKV